ncbi:hypothetical protein HDF12_003498 [Edaphobacter lichenicola]|uniref:Uncharacterized protein n=1 Tax=Tunturiibacter lichenicola TaxID=2051959 RepID=A0A7Y9T6A1_9BACT|nr:hypothetical protein [Edaphobacter lichenicola]
MTGFGGGTNGVLRRLDAVPCHDPMRSKRISVLMEGESVPLLPGQPTTNNERSPWTGMILERHRLGAVAIPEHEHTRFVCIFNPVVRSRWTGTAPDKKAVSDRMLAA